MLSKIYFNISNENNFTMLAYFMVPVSGGREQGTESYTTAATT